jgi:glycosyltransferase involved in cell wall biosynthesis
MHITTVPQTLYFLVAHFRALKAMDIEVEAISASGDDLDRLSEAENIKIHAISMSRQVTPFKDLFALFQLVRLFRTSQPTIVHAHTPKGGLLGMLAAWIAGVPVRVYHIHGLPLETAQGLKRNLLAWSEWVACRCAHQVYSVSPSVRDVIVRERLCPGHHIRTLKKGSISGIDASSRFVPALHDGPSRMAVRSRWGIGPQDVVIGFVGRIVGDKGIRELAASWQILRPEFTQLHLLIVGDLEANDPELEILCSKLREDSRVHLVGTDRNTPPLYSAMDIVALPTYREGLPYVPLEAAAMELPVVATRVTGCVDLIVDNVTGKLISPRSVPELSDALRSYIVDSEQRHRHGAAARQHVLKNFAPENVLAATFDEYKCLLKDRGRSWPTPPEAARRAA